MALKKYQVSSTCYTWILMKPLGFVPAGETHRLHCSSSKSLINNRKSFFPVSSSIFFKTDGAFSFCFSHLRVWKHYKLFIVQQEATACLSRLILFHILCCCNSSRLSLWLFFKASPSLWRMTRTQVLSVALSDPQSSGIPASPLSTAITGVPIHLILKQTFRTDKSAKDLIEPWHLGISSRSTGSSVLLTSRKTALLWSFLLHIQGVSSKPHRLEPVYFLTDI